MLQLRNCREELQTEVVPRISVYRTNILSCKYLYIYFVRGEDMSFISGCIFFIKRSQGIAVSASILQAGFIQREGARIFFG